MNFYESVTVGSSRFKHRRFHPFHRARRSSGRREGRADGVEGAGETMGEARKSHPLEKIVFFWMNDMDNPMK